MNRRWGPSFQVSRTPLPVPNTTAVQRALREVMGAAATFAKALWYQRAQDLRIRASGAYLRGIQDAEVRVQRNVVNGTSIELVFEIVNTAPHAAVVEHGHPAFHLPSKVDWSAGNGAIKRTKDGTPYMHVPFVHSAYMTAYKAQRAGLTVATQKRMLPSDVYSAARQLAITAIAGTPRDRRGQSTGNRTYRDNTPGPQTRVYPGGGAVEFWRGERTVVGRAAGGARLTNPAWKTSKFQGLFRTSMSGGGSRYLTIRTMRADSPGWNIPAQQGLGVARQVASALNGGTGHERFSRLLAEVASKALLSGGT